MIIIYGNPHCLLGYLDYFREVKKTGFIQIFIVEVKKLSGDND